ncbi:hypothetical protein Syun_017934 [Stephania yunnanensis]|uniref:Uncharacterized protein n=1 Tax=Stephania yunnanensis TaxID=152371 RepID=A0AAP0ITA0_9MAGN
MGRPPSNGGPAFRFNATEVAEMEACLVEANNTIPSREALNSLAEKFRFGIGSKIGDMLKRRN